MANDLEQRADEILAKVCEGDEETVAYLCGGLVPIAKAREAIVAALQQAQQPGVTDAMVRRFLNWRLPGHIKPDGVYPPRDAPYPMTGTNLLDYDAAKAMLEWALVDMSPQAQLKRVLDEAFAPDEPEEAQQPGAQAVLTFAHFRAANVARCIKWHPEGIASWSPSDWLTAVTGELGELASLLKMRNRERDGLPGNKFSPTDKMIADELADVLTYLDLLAAVLGVDLGAAAVAKFNEVSERVGFPDRIDLAAPPPLPEGVSEEDVEAAMNAWVSTEGGEAAMRAALESYRARLAAKGASA